MRVCTIDYKFMRAISLSLLLAWIIMCRLYIISFVDVLNYALAFESLRSLRCAGNVSSDVVAIFAGTGTAKLLLCQSQRDMGVHNLLKLGPLILNSFESRNVLSLSQHF